MCSRCRSPEPAASAERTSWTGRPLLWAAGLVLVALVAVLAVVVTRSDREVLIPGDRDARRSETGTATRAGRAAALLSELEDALENGTRREVLALAAPAPEARRGLGQIFDNVRRLDLTDLSFRFVGEDPEPLTGPDRRVLGPDAWVGDVAVGWRIDGFDRHAADTEVSLTFVDGEKGLTLGTTTGDYGEPAPLWLLSRLAVRDSGRALVAVSDPGSADRMSRLAERAVRDVRAVLPSWGGGLVVEVPASQEQLHRLLDAKPGAYASIAAVTASVDGTNAADAPVHVLVNPDVFGRLGDKGSQIVMSHEATHVAVDAATATMPLWLLEGFADYVALARSDLPVEVTGSQILAEVRRHGPPTRLPGPKEFDPSNKLLGTSYEAAWLACRLIAEQHGERRLVDFYEQVDEGASMMAVFADLGTTQAAFTREWRDYLRTLAG